MSKKHNDWLTAKFFNIYFIQTFTRNHQDKNSGKFGSNKLHHQKHEYFFGYLENMETCVEL